MHYRLVRRMLGVKPTDRVRMTKAYESLGITSLLSMGYEIASHEGRTPPDDGNVL